MRPDGPRPTVVGPDGGPAPPFPLRIDGEVVKGFGRGSKELGIPTANIPLEGLTVGGHQDMESGVYYGWAGLSEPPSNTTNTSTTSTETTTEPTPPSPIAGVYPMVMSLGWNPFYKNTVRSLEVHILHPFPQDFYGSHMNLVILGFIRPEYDYVSKEALIEDIKEDCNVALRGLQREAYEKFKEDKYLSEFEGKGKVGK